MNPSSGYILVFVLLLAIPTIKGEENKFLDDICGHINGQRIYLEYGESGMLEAKYNSNILEKFMEKSRNNLQKRCTVELISCPSCIIKIKFKYLNLSRNCGRSTLFDTCGCDYVWIYEPTFEQSSEQFCGRFINSNLSSLSYNSQTRKVVVVFLYSRDYKHAFSLDYLTDRNKIILKGYPKVGNVNNGNQILSSPFFPNSYPPDLTMELDISCEPRNETCRISLVFTDFLIASSSIIEFFDWNNERIYVATGSIFRPSVITTSGPSLVIRFYANGATNLGFKAYYSFILENGSQRQLTPNIDCGGQVNNLGGGITMMNMISDGLKFFDCVWLINPTETYLHMKTYLYIKVVNFSGFAGNTELIIRQGLTSTGATAENLKFSLTHFYTSKQREHIVPISQGFYVRFKGLFRPESRLTLVYAAFNYKECLAGSDFLCQNKRCISALLNCDGFDHCGDSSDESTVSCSKDPRDRRQWSKTPHFLFQKVEGMSELATSALVFLLYSFGLIGFIFAMVILLYRMNLKSRHQRQIQDHLETINAILEEGVGEVEEEIIIPDDPPNYEAPPDYDDVVKVRKESKRCKLRQTGSSSSCTRQLETGKTNVEGTSRSYHTLPIVIPDSPPPAYDDGARFSTGVPSYDNYRTFKFFENIQVPLITNSYDHILNKVRSGDRVTCKIGNVKSKYFSDSELTVSCIFGENAISSRLKKSRTIDDMNLFI